MPRARAIKDTGIVDESLPGMPQDPAPAGAKRGPGRPRGSTTKKTTAKIGIRGSDGRAVSKAQLKQQVATELYGFASLFAGMWSLRDPICAGVLTEEVTLPGLGTQERLAAIVDQAVEILARNDKVLTVLAAGGVIGQVGMLASLLMPVAKQVWHSHGPGGDQHGIESEVDYEKYPAPALR